jgi:hypothetical protein
MLWRDESALGEKMILRFGMAAKLVFRGVVSFILRSLTRKMPT